MSRENDIVVHVPPSINDVLIEALGNRTLEEIEVMAASGQKLPFTSIPDWQEFSKTVWNVYGVYDHVILVGLSPQADGRALIAAINILGEDFLTFGHGSILKHLAMSPWSRGLAQSGAEGYFHTDLNASPNPPAITGIQCVIPDPGAPDFGYNRIARVKDLLAELNRRSEIEAISFLTHQQVEMANDRSVLTWSGCLVEDGIARFHPETIRAACARRGTAPPEKLLASIYRAAIEISTPLNLQRGDILLFSNHRTLHYRSECSVQFRNFPMEFEARQVHLLHVNKEHNHE